MIRTIAKFEVEHLYVLDDEGNVDSDMPKLTDKQINEIYETMSLIRTYDEKAFSMQRQGRIGSYLQVKGQEASQVGCVYALDKKDFVVPMYRSGGAMLAFGFPMHQLFMYWSGDERGMKAPDDRNILPMAIPVGTQSAHASGIAWAAKLKGTKEVAMGFLGDGATSKADFHTAMNFAGVYKAPMVLVCENNQFAISTHISKQTASETIAQKAIAYGVRGIQVDGNDVFAVYKAAKEAVDRARNGEGPTFIECFTYRMCDHSTSDDAKRYRSELEVKDWEKKDPIIKLERYMEKKGLLTKEYKEKVQKASTDKVEEAVKKFESMPPANKEDIFTYMFKEMPSQLQEQFSEFKGV
jgi:pyruvate dehydrogenase E1 component alpha subunit